MTRVPNKSVEDLASRMPNPFGLIKDLHVSNILPADSDKTKDFNDKDFSQVFVKYASPTDSAAMLDHRPPQSPYSPRDPPPDDESRLVAASDWEPHSQLAPPSDAESHPLPDPPPSEVEVTSTDGLDPADLHVDAQMLESLLHGAEQYTTANDPGPPMGEHVILLAVDGEEDDDADAVFV